jgi:hypothetical protein
LPPLMQPQQSQLKRLRSNQFCTGWH